mmetsp:Transcript_42349/g.64980  ORF Transcript_42349/g.64980 Transcript_42349/m.64980 type:complete len:90 (+) Transcript_42349:1418-1687(+)
MRIPAIYMSSLDLKLQQLRAVRINLRVFYSLRVIFQFALFGARIKNGDNQYLRYLLTAAFEWVDMINTIALVWVLRPRKEWPQFYGLGS